MSSVLKKMIEPWVCTNEFEVDVTRELAKSKSMSHIHRIWVPLEPGSLIYNDVWGSSELMSLLKENIYTIGFIDAATEKAWLYLSKKKSGMLNCFYATLIVKRRASYGLKDFII